MTQPNKKLDINDVLACGPAPQRVPRIELQQHVDGWVVNLVNHKHQHRSGAGLQPKHEAFALARELAAFLDWPIVRVRGES
jgi:hypothetical protein